MAWRKHNRHVSKQQFADSTTIDGSRVEDALQDVEDHVNEVPLGDIKQRFVQTQFVAGYSPHAEAWADGTDQPTETGNVEELGAQESTALTGTIFPFLPVYNSAKNLSQIAPIVTPESFTNPHRVKGYRIPGVDIEPENGFGFEQVGVGSVPAKIYEEEGQYSWEMSWAFRRPVIFTNISIFLMVDDTGNGQIPSGTTTLMPFRNDFLFDNPPNANPPYATGSPSEDLWVQLAVDDLFLKEDRSLTNVEVTRHRFQITKENVSVIDWTTFASGSDMEPTLYPGGHPKGCAINLNCNVPIPEDSRVRMSLMLPKYDSQESDSSPPSGWPVHGGWRGVPWFRQYYTVCVTALEEIS
jgi:hypothetical protein